MGWWFSEAKKDDIVFVPLEADKEDSTKLSGKHPLIVESNNGREIKGIGCTSNSSMTRFGAIKVETENGKLDRPTYARPDQGLRSVTADSVKATKGSFPFNDKATNADDIRKGLK